MFEGRLIKSATWLINIRWIAILLIFSVTYFAKNILNISIQDTQIYYLSLILLFFNLILFITVYFIRRKRESLLRKFAKIIINAQIIIDLILLTFLLHYSGGIENPFIIIYIFHMIIASIMLSVRNSFLLTSFALILVGLLTGLEYYSIIPHFQLKGFVSHDLHMNRKYLICTGIVFIGVSYFVLYMTTKITWQLKKMVERNRIANIQLMENDKIKNEYVLRITHDIKGHVAAIQSCLEAASININDNVKEKQIDFINRASKRTRSLSGFIKGILYLTKLQLSNKLDIYEFNFTENVNKLFDTLNNMAKEKQIKLNWFIDDSISYIKGNQVSVEEIISNLVTNAIKYTPNNGEVNVNINDKNEEILIEVTDNGIGIPKEDQSKLFEDFFRASNVSMRDGAGIGLSLVKQLVNRYNGKIRFKSTEGKGTSFFVSLPKELK